VDALIAKLQAIQQQKAELLKQEMAVLVALNAEKKRLMDLFDKFGLNGPVPPVPPVPPAPQPNPKPPDVPPTPAPPVDPLKVKLKAAFDAETATAKRDQAKDLAALYRQAAKLAADATVVTSGDLLGRVRDAAKSLVGADSLKGLRSAAGAELGLLLPTDADLTADQRAAVAKLFGRLADALEELAK
jgi:hypothetical protein